MKSIILALLACTVASAQRDVAWDDLRIKWDLNIFDENSFRQYPVTQSDAEDQGFSLVDDRACDDGLPGLRFAEGGDLSTIIVYDVNGYIAGVQMAISQADGEANSGGFPFDAQPVFRPDTINEVDYWVLAAYFIEPAQVCVGRTEAEFEESGTGTGLFIMTGAELTEYENPPNFQEEVDMTDWTQGYCFVSMGEHYWYNMSVDLDCNEFFPVFLLFNQGELTGFGWSVQGVYPSEHTEYPPSFVLNLFINPIPECLPPLVDTIGVTTQHIYFNAGLTNVVC